MSLASLALAGATVGAGCYQLSSDCSLFACGSTGGPDGGTGGDGGSVPVGCDPSRNTNPVDKNVTLFGALNCEKGWAYEEKTRTQLTADNDEIALKLTSGASGSEVYDFAITAMKAMTEGGSSIAVLADGATATLTRCDLVAGDGAKGKDGDPGGANGTAAATGSSGNLGADACMGDPANGNPGGSPVPNACGGADVVSVGGKGGAGNVSTGDDGQKGQSGPLGVQGAGEPLIGTWSCAANGTGQGGDNGTSGDPGPGASGIGGIAPLGYQGADGSPGMPGTPGQGGGAGAARKAAQRSAPEALPELVLRAGVVARVTAAANRGKGAKLVGPASRCSASTRRSRSVTAI
ncbi:PE-PGRS family protein [Minicystis rosea]|nr:PE-PGRS family protein [Minicystis rosea]